METFKRQRALSVLVLVACCLVSPLWADSQRAVEAREGAFENLIESADRWKDVRELTGNNDHPMITRAMKLCGLSGNKGYPWCAASMADIFDFAEIPAPHSARVVDWFKNNVVWESPDSKLPEFSTTQGMVGALYYRSIGRYGHIFMIIGEDKNNFYTLEGNTNIAGSREGDGFYRKIRSKKSVAALADYCVNRRDFILMYDNYLQKNDR